MDTQAERIPIASIRDLEEEGATCVVAGRLVQLSPATLTLEDQTDRRTFGFPNNNPDLTRVRLGDILEVTLMLRQKAWRVMSHRVLTPCMLDQEKMRQWMARWMETGNRKRRNLVLRDAVMRSMRDYFLSDNFLEVATPTLVACPGMEPNLTGFSSQWVGPFGGWEQNYYLPTSPEFHMKKLLVLGYERIFEFARCFRNREFSAHHQPEFTMLEWYRAYSDYETIMTDTEQLVSKAAQDALGTMTIQYQGRTIDLTPPWPRVSVRDLFLQRLKIDLSETRNAPALARAAIERGFSYVSPNETFEVVFFKLFLTEIEERLGWDRPVILRDYPMEMSALARRKPKDQRYCERFEVYIAGIELANAFGELTNAPEQKRRFMDDMAESDKERGFHYEPDEEFLEALSFGMPPSAGIALGVDRVAMLLANETSLFPVTAFPHRSPVGQKEEN